jgi:putative nucleotidyltransferase with HDIG domain
VRRQGEPLVKSLAPARQAALLEIGVALVRPNTSLNLRASDERRQAAVAGVKDVTITLRRGEIIVRDGVPLTAHHVRLLAGIAEKAGGANELPTFAGVAGVVLLLLVAVWRLGRASIRNFPRDTRDAVFLLSALVATALGTRLGLYLCDALAERPELAPWLGPDATPLYFVIPIAAAAMIVRMVHSAETAALFSVLVALVAGLQVRGEVAYAAFALIGSLTGAHATARVSQRGTLLRAGLRVGAVQMGVVAALGLLSGGFEVGAVLIGMLLALASGVLAGVLVSGLAPAIETVFGYTTDVKLLELANREQEVLRDLELRAPGTYHHSMMVGHLAEKAAEAIGANALLAKVAGYYHDIGKMRRPHFFVENFPAYGGENRHEKLSPPMSARIIQAHVKDGLEIGRDYKLAEPILAGIAQHHGTSVIRFFYEKAKEQAQPEKGQTIEEHEYRYSGPRPQTREAGLLMLADSVEAASRTLADTSPARIQQLVQRVINNYFRDGQLDECSLTLRDLHAIARSFIDTLSAIRHERIDYPEATDGEGRRLDEAADEGLVERLEPRAKDRSEGPSKRREDDLKRLGLP